MAFSKLDGKPSSLRTILLVLLLAAVICFGVLRGGRHQHSAESRSGKPPSPLSVLSLARTLEPGVIEREACLPSPAGWFKVWIYLPETIQRHMLPCILIAPAGTRLFHGTVLHDSDRREHIPWVHAGYVVVAYELDGGVSDDPSVPEFANAAKAFQAAGGGLANERAALNFALAQCPAIDSKRIYTVGHSSAATHALMVAEHEPRIAACIAFAPVTHIESHIGEEAISLLADRVPGFRPFIRGISPDSAMASLRCPVFIFHSEGDTVVLDNQVHPFVEDLRRTNPQVTFVNVPTGTHSGSMIDQGIPMAIRWLNTLSVKSQ